MVKWLEATNVFTGREINIYRYMNRDRQRERESERERAREREDRERDHTGGSTVR